MNKLYKAHIQCLIYVVAVSIISVSVAVFLSVNVPKETGTIELDKDYRLYSEKELRSLLKEELSTQQQRGSVFKYLQNRGVIFQALLWVFGVIVLRKAGNKYLLYSALMLAFMSGVGLFSLFQVVLFFSCIVVTHFILKMGAMKATSAH